MHNHHAGKFYGGQQAAPSLIRMSEDTYLHARYDLLGGSNRWMPRKSSTTKMQLYMDDLEIRLEHHAGSYAATWVILPKAKIASWAMLS